MRRVFLFLFFLVLGTFVFSADFSCAAGPTDVYLTTITEPTTWTKANSPYILHYKLTVKKKLIIEPGTVVKFASSATGIETRAEISAVGTKNEKIVFTSIHDDSAGGNSDAGSERASKWGDWDKINVSPYYAAKFENVVVSYASTGILAQSTVSQYKNLEIKNSEIKDNVTGIDLLNVSPVIESNIISGNYYGISTQLYAQYPERVVTIRYNTISGNDIGVFANNHGFPFKEPTVDARWNWWGDESGPKSASKNPGGKGDMFTENWVSFDPWLKVDPNIGLDPVIVIPGIMGSWEVDGEWKIDPIFHTYDNLCEEFLANGYEDGKNFSVFPYEWRNSNVDNAKLLRDRINQIKTDTGRPKVDIVAHSMGGLLAREYIESDYYAGDVDQLITVGTPQLGAPKDYVTWEAGEFLGLWSPVMKRLVALEALENGYLDVFDYVRKRPMKSVEELLPTYDYLYDENGSDYVLRSGYPVNYPRNEFLENLNNADNIKLLKNTEFTKIVGDTGSKTSTECEYHVVDADKSSLWEHGYPKYFDIPVLSRQGIIKCNGDGTVPLVSAEASDIPANKTMYFQSEHGDLPTDAQKDILEILTGKRPSEEVDGWHIPSVLVVLLHSPIDMQVISPGDEKIGKNFETGGTYNEIEGAYYTGFDTNTEFLTIPNPEDGEYQILTEGTGTGEYTIETTKITENEKTGETVETTETITGTAELDKQEENKIKIDGDSVKKVEPLTLSPKKKEEEKKDAENLQIVPVLSQNKESPEIFQDQILVVDLLNDQPAETPTKIQQIDDLKNSVREYFKTKQIRKKSERSYLLGWLGNIRVYIKRRNILEKQSKTSQKSYGKLQKKIVGHCNYLIRHLNKNSPKKIDESAKNDLVERLNSLKL